MTKLPSPEMIKHHSARISIAIMEEQVWRMGAKQDLLKEDIPFSFPEILHPFAPAAASIIEREMCYRQEKNQGARHPHPEQLIQKWIEARKDLWTPLPAERKTLRNWLKQLQPPCSLSISAIQKHWKQHKDLLPFHLKDCNLRTLLDSSLDITLHQGYTHNALRPRRIRENGFICWRHSSAEGLRGVDIAPFVSAKHQPLDVQLHILKWSWKHDPLKLAQTLFEMGLVKTKSQASNVFLKNYHPAISKSQILQILGIQEGLEARTKIGKALYRTQKLNIGDIPIQLETSQPIQPVKDPDFFLPRRRGPEALFSRWNQGILVDEQGRYSVTPERQALKIAEQIQHPIVLDAFCGCGGNTIGFARQSQIKKVIGFELDPKRYQMAKHNISLYNLSAKIELHHGSIFQHFPPAPFVFLDPPWEWGIERLENLRIQFQQKYAHGMMKVPVSFPFPQASQVKLYLTAESYPSFAILQW